MEKITQEYVYNEYRKKVFGYIIGKINDRNIAEDLTSCVFLKVVEKLKSFDENKSSLSTWVYTITRNTVIDYFRTNKKTAELNEFCCTESVEDDFINKENLENLKDGLKSLEKLELKVIVLRYYSGKTLKEIAVNTGYSYSYIKDVDKKAKNKLKKYF